jgi:hypothetical protein
MEDCIVYLIYQLRHAGYEVRYSPPNMMHISWLHHEKSYMIEQSPIMQAMIPPEIKKEQKKREKHQAKSVTFAPDIRAPVSEQRPVAARSALDYEPPSSFVQSVQKPLPERKNNILADLWNFN